MGRLIKEFSTGDISALCDVTSRTASVWIDTGKLKGYRLPGVNGERRVKREDLIQFLKANGMHQAETLERESIQNVLALDISPLLADALRCSRPDGYCLTATDGFFRFGYMVAELKPVVVIVDMSIGSNAAKVLADWFCASTTMHGIHLIALTGDESNGALAATILGFNSVCQIPYNAWAIWETIQTRGNNGPNK